MTALLANPAAHASAWMQKAPTVANRRSVTFLLLCSAILMLMTFSPHGRDLSVKGGVNDAVAVAKAIARLSVLMGLVGYLFMHRQRIYQSGIIRRLLPWYLFGALAVVSILWSPLKSVSLNQSSSFVLLLFLATAIGITATPESTSRILHGLTLAIIFACVILLTVYFTLPDWNSISRSASGLSHATNSSATAAIGLLILVGSRILYGWSWTRRLLPVGIVLFGLTLILAQNRTAIGVTGVVISGLMLICLPAFWRSLVISTLGFLGLTYLTADTIFDISGWLVDAISQYAARGQSTQQLTELSGRAEMWEVMWDSFMESPWLGHGYFVSSSSGELYVWYFWTNWTAHNFCLQVLVSVGLIGFSIMVWAMITHAVSLLRGARRGKFEWQLAALVGSVMLWQIGWGLNNESFVGPLEPESVVYLVLVGLVAGRSSNETNRQPTFLDPEQSS